MNILGQIVEHKREEVASRRRNVNVTALQEMEYFHRKPASLKQSLKNGKPFSIIAEIKRSSPSAGSIVKNIAPQTLALDYQSNGAAGISVLTDERFFSGTLDDLQSVRESVSVPLLRKDFIIDDYQLYEAKAHGADAVLLIAAILEKSQLQELHSAATELGLECLVELYEQKEIDRLDFDSMNLIGINNRDLRTFNVDLHHSVEMAKLLPQNITTVSESGIQSDKDLRKLMQAGITSALIGEHFMKSDNPGEALKKLLQEFENETVS